MSLPKVLNEVQKFPFLYNRLHREYGNKELCARTWDIIAARIYGDQWVHLTYAEKAKKVTALQKKLSQSDLDDLGEIHRPTGSSAATEVAVVDLDRELLVNFLLPNYKRLSASEKLKVLSEFNDRLEVLLSDTTDDTTEHAS